MKLNRIKEVLDDKGITQTWLAKKLGKSFSVVNAYACNRQQPPLETLFNIAEIKEKNRYGKFRAIYRKSTFKSC